MEETSQVQNGIYTSLRKHLQDLQSSWDLLSKNWQKPKYSNLSQLLQLPTSSASHDNSHGRRAVRSPSPVLPSLDLERRTRITHWNLVELEDMLNPVLETDFGDGRRRDDREVAEVADEGPVLQYSSVVDKELERVSMERQGEGIVAEEQDRHSEPMEVDENPGDVELAEVSQHTRSEGMESVVTQEESRVAKDLVTDAETEANRDLQGDGKQREVDNPSVVEGPEPQASTSQLDASRDSPPLTTSQEPATKDNQPPPSDTSQVDILSPPGNTSSPRITSLRVQSISLPPELQPIHLSGPLNNINSADNSQLRARSEERAVMMSPPLRFTPINIRLPSRPCNIHPQPPIPKYEPRTELNQERHDNQHDSTDAQAKRSVASNIEDNLISTRETTGVIPRDESEMDVDPPQNLSSEILVDTPEEVNKHTHDEENEITTAVVETEPEMDNTKNNNEVNESAEPLQPAEIPDNDAMQVEILEVPAATQVARAVPEVSDSTPDDKVDSGEIRPEAEKMVLSVMEDVSKAAEEAQISSPKGVVENVPTPIEISKEVANCMKEPTTEHLHDKESVNSAIADETELQKEQQIQETVPPPKEPTTQTRPLTPFELISPESSTLSSVATPLNPPTPPADLSYPSSLNTPSRSTSPATIASLPINTKPSKPPKVVIRVPPPVSMIPTPVTMSTVSPSELSPKRITIRYREDDDVKPPPAKRKKTRKVKKVTTPNTVVEKTPAALATNTSDTTSTKGQRVILDCIVVRKDFENVLLSLE